MIKNLTQLEMEVDGKRYVLLCENDAPISVIQQVLNKFEEYCEQLLKEILAQRKTQLQEKEESKEPEQGSVDHDIHDYTDTPSSSVE